MNEFFFVTDPEKDLLFFTKPDAAFDDLPDTKQNLLNLFDPKSKIEIDKLLTEATQSKKSYIFHPSVRLLFTSPGKDAELNIKLIYNKKNELINLAGIIKIQTKDFINNHNIQIGSDFFDNLLHGIYRTGIDGKIIYANQGFAKILGYHSVKELININIQDLFVDQSRRDELIKLSIENISNSLEIQIYRKDKSKIWIKGSCSVVSGADRNIGYIDGIIEDITQQHENEQELLKSKMLLEEVNLNKDKFFSIISHDLKSPFSQIIGATEHLMGKIDEYNKENIRKFLGLLKEESVHSYRLLENLLQWSKNQRGMISYNPVPIYVPYLIKEVLSVFNQIANNKNIKIKTKTSQDLYIYADKEMIATILRNLLSNAIKFTYKNGEINIIARYRIEVNEMVETYVEFSITDNGMGIPKDNLTNIFSLPVNRNSKGTYNESGTGLGLIVCKEFIEKHGGKIWVESEENKGSNFIFTIP